MPSNLLSAAKAVLARYDHDGSPYVPDDALAKGLRKEAMEALRRAVKEAERASPKKGDARCACVGHRHVQTGGRCGWDVSGHGLRCSCRVPPKGGES